MESQELPTSTTSTKKKHTKTTTKTKKHKTRSSTSTASNWTTTTEVITDTTTLSESITDTTTVSDSNSDNFVSDDDSTNDTNFEEITSATSRISSTSFILSSSSIKSAAPIPRSSTQQGQQENSIASPDISQTSKIVIAVITSLLLALIVIGIIVYTIKYYENKKRKISRIETARSRQSNMNRIRDSMAMKKQSAISGISQFETPYEDSPSVTNSILVSDRVIRDLNRVKNNRKTVSFHPQLSVPGNTRSMPVCPRTERNFELANAERKSGPIPSKMRSDVREEEFSALIDRYYESSIFSEDLSQETKVRNSRDG